MRREIDNKLQPNRNQVRNIKECVKSILDRVNTIEVISNLAHEEIISFEIAQKNNG